jgi:hypothetical protein
MKKLAQLFCLTILSVNTGCSGQPNANNEMNFEGEKYKSGQIWQYETREGEEDSRVMILKVDKTKKEVIVHISVLNVKIKKPQKEGDFTTEIGHLPFSRESIDKSLTKLESSNNELPDFLEGYNQWKEAFDSGQGGIFSIIVKEAVGYVEQTMNQ